MNESLYDTIHFERPDYIAPLPWEGYSHYFFRAAVVDIPLEHAPSTIRVVAYDFAGNHSESTITNIYPDAEPPVVTPISSLYSADTLDKQQRKFDMTQTFSVEDAGVGVKGPIAADNFQWGPALDNSGDLEFDSPLFSQVGPAGDQHYQLQYLNFNRDNKYKAWGQAEDKLGNSGPSEDLAIFFGLSAGPLNGTIPVIQVNDQGQYEALFQLKLGRFFADNDIGYASLTSYLNGTPVISFDDAQIDDFYSAVAGNEKPEVAFEDPLTSLIDISYTRTLDHLNLPPHSRHEVFTKAFYHNGYEEENDRLLLTLPNIPLHKDYNDLSLKFYREGHLAEDLGLADLEQDQRGLFYVEDFQIRLDGPGGVNGRDREGDALYLLVRTEEGTLDPIPCFEGLIRFEGATGTVSTDQGVKVSGANLERILSVEVLETYEETDELTGDPVAVTNPYDLSLSIGLDKDLQRDFIHARLSEEDLEGHLWEAGQVVATREGSFEWRLSFGSLNDDGSVNDDFYDLSGIRRISLFEFAPEVTEPGFEDYLGSDNVETLEFALKGPGRHDPSQTYTVAFALNPQEEGRAALRKMGVYVEDFAGNHTIFSQHVYYDRAAPAALDPDQGVIRWFAGAEEKENLSYFDYDQGTGAIILALDLEETAPYGSLEECRIEAFTASDQITGEVEIQDRQSRIVLPLREDFLSDEPVDLRLVFTDYAGNVTENRMTLYTPSYFPAGAEPGSYIRETATEWDDQGESPLGHYLGWEQIALPAGGLVIYYDDGAPETPDTALPPAEGAGDFVHAGLNAHQESLYYLKARNRSGYESAFAAGEIPFVRRLKNNPPFILSYREEGAFAGPQDTYIGPLNNLILTFADHDESDDFVLTVNLNGEMHKTEEISGAGSLERVFNVSDLLPDLAEDEVYTVNYEITDFWDTTGTLETGDQPAKKSALYRYDGRAPELADYAYDRREGFSCLYGDIHLDLKEEGAGLVRRVLLEEAAGDLEEVSDGSFVTEEEPREGYTHRIGGLPETEERTLFLQLEDGVGNRSTKQIGPFTRDATSPVVTDARLGGESEIFSRPAVPVEVSWEDNLSGASKILYQFTDGEVLVKEGEVSPAEEGMSQTLWSVLCSLSESRIDDQSAYSLRIKVLDKAGNGAEAPWQLVSDAVRIDSSSPVITITGREGWLFNRGRYYLGSRQEAALTWQITDTHPTGQVWYELLDQGSLRSSDTLDAVLTGLTDGNSYDLRIATRDEAGNTGRSEPFSFLWDSRPPESSSLALSLSGSGTYSPGQQVRFTLEAVDTHSGIETISLWVGHSAEGIEVPVISRLLPGHLEDGTLPLAYSEGKTYSFNLPDAASGHYFFKAAAVDFAGNRSPMKVLAGETLHYGEQAESLRVHDYSVYTNNPHELSARWEYRGEKELNHYAYRVIEAQSGQPVSEWEYTFKDHGTVLFPRGLEAGKAYYFEVYAGFEDCSRSASRFSPGSLLDVTPPVLRTLSVPSYGPLSRLKVDWEALEAESAIGSVTAVLETYETDPSGKILTDAVQQEGRVIRVPRRKALGAYPLAASSRGEGIQVVPAQQMASWEISDGQRLMLTLQVSDLAGNLVERQAPLFVKDSSAPPVPVVLDGGDFVNPEKNQVRFDWQWSPQDSHSGVDSYAYQVLLPRQELDEEGWIPVEGTAVELPDPGLFANGSEVVLAVKATNGAGLSSIGYSNGIVLDNTKPAVAEVKLLGTGGEEIAYLLDRSAHLWMHSEDDQSGISQYRYEPGTFDGTDWRPLAEDFSEVLSGEQAIPVTVPEALESLGVIYYRATAFNTAGDASSLPGYSAGAKLFEGVPLVSGVVGETVNGGLQFLWDAENTIPLREITLSLLKNGLVEEQVRVGGSVRSHFFDGLGDGYYQLRIDYKAANAAENGAPVSSALVCLDRSAPDMSDLAYTRYVNDLFRYSFHIRDNLTGSGGYRFRMGPAGSPDQLTSGWVWKDSTGSYQERTVSFEQDFAGGYDCLVDGGSLLFSFQVKDRSGNWSPVYYSEPVLVDRTAPEAPAVDKDRNILAGEILYQQSSYYAAENDRLGGVMVAGEDEQSGITGYRWAVRETGSPEPLSWSAVIPYDGGEDILPMEMTGQVLEGLVLENGREYEVYAQVVNGSGIFSEAGRSPGILADFSAPVFQVLTAASGLGEEMVEGRTGLIYNGGGEVFLQVLEEAGEVLYLSWSLVDPDGVEGESAGQYYLGEDVTELDVSFQPPEEEKFGRYQLKIALRDAGGYESVLWQDIRLNSPPDFSLQNVVTHPMKPFDLAFSDWVKDLDAITAVDIEILHGAGSDRWSQSSPMDLKFLAYDHSEIFAGRTEYVYRVSAEDEFGQRSEAEGNIVIVNTPEGTLYTDEYWTGTHQITGPVIIPEGLSLHIDQESLIQIVPVAGHQTPLIRVDPGGLLEHRGRAVYELMDRSLDVFWEGLLIEGEAVLDEITVKDARRGLSLFSDQVPLIQGAVFQDNLIGLHLFAVNPEIAGCTFSGNVFYGIKEDEGSRPVVKDNLFTGNGYDYYDLDRTVLSAGELNSLEDNSGNRGDN